MAIDLQQYFRLRCSNMLIMERNIWQIYTEMIRDTKNPMLKELLEHNNRPLRHRISNLEQVVDKLGGIIGQEVDPVTRGMMEAYRIFMDLNPPQEYIDLHNALEAERIEHLELGAYDGLIRLAKHLHLGDIAELLELNLTGERRMCEVLGGEIPKLLTQLGEGRRAA